MTARESVDAKARRYLTEERLVVLQVDGDSIAAECRDPARHRRAEGGVITAAETCTAGELLEASLCSARCLIALAPGPCGCPCKGRWHGVLAGVDVGGGITPEERADRRAAAQAAATAAATAAKAARRADPAIVRGHAARDGRLSRSARGLLAELLSLPPGRPVTAEMLAETGPEGRDAIRRMLRELEDAGYIERRKERDDRGQWCSSLVICELHVTAVRRAEQILAAPEAPPRDDQIMTAGRTAP